MSDLKLHKHTTLNYSLRDPSGTVRQNLCHVQLQEAQSRLKLMGSDKKITVAVMERRLAQKDAEIEGLRAALVQAQVWSPFFAL